ncbi:uncharacterized protein LOC115212292 isoform X2 [Octopus sinensis]|uniref:Uncharacterized protein LOC115212292 isoform X2 n=1 Tax=Octopus sinensis TaxID=2607531 RepID=A0A7E6EWJ1_9MOLL|nr:uncharacterized protein LOC115212292 isoform X2 [Octopus sinensis]
MMILYTRKRIRCLSYRPGSGLHGFLLLMIFTTTLAQKSATNLQCENGWYLISGQCYSIFNSSQTWHQANSTCNSYSSILAEPLGYHVNKRLGDTISKLNRNYVNAWIGYTYLNAQKSVTNITKPFWSDGSESSVAFGLWGDSQPSLEQGKCCNLKYSNEQWKWSLNRCSNPEPFICQKPACPKDTFNCGLTGQRKGRCLDRSKVCDGHTDCENGLDEADCAEDCQFLLKQSEGEIKLTNIIQRLAKSLSCQWIIEGKVGSKLQIWFESTDILQDQAELEVWVGARSVSESYLAAILKEPRKPAEYILSYNNFIIIRLQVQSTENLKSFQIKWLSGLRCSWIPYPHHVHLESEPTHCEQCDLNKCMETCEKLKNCSMITVNHDKGLCELYPMVPLSVESSCCDSYVKSCPEATDSSDLLSRDAVLMSTDEYQSIYSPLYPNMPPGNMEKTWLLLAPFGDIVTLQVQDLMLSNEDELIVYNGESDLSEIYVKFTNAAYQYSTPIISTKNTMYIKYNTGIFPNKSRGFLAKFRKGCTFKVDSNFGYVSSPGYGTTFSYPPNVVCEWEIAPKSTMKHLILEFSPKFGLENGKDFLEVYNGTISFENKLHQGEGFTGTTVPPILTSNSQKFILTLRTSANTAGVGFNATFYGDSYCGPVPVLEGGRWIHTSGFNTGNNATFECFENFEAKSGNTIYCDKNGNWEPQPECSVKTCPTLQPVLGGTWENIQNINGLMIFHLTCKTPNYQISGSPDVFCWNGTWSGNPTCCRQKCNLKMFANVIDRTSITGYMKGDSVNITCAQGYKLVGKNPFLCGVDPIPSCQPVVCETPQIANATILSLQNIFYFNDSVKVVCSEGYELVGNSTITCQHYGNWTSLPTCEEAECPPVERNVFTFEGTVDPAGKTKYGEIVNITCNINVQKVYQRRCLYDLKNKIFTTLGESSKCHTIDCGQPKQIPGMVMPDQFNCTHHGCSFEFQCLQPLFKVAGESAMKNQTVICGKTGRWTFNNLTCVGPSCSDPGTPPDARQNFTSYEVGNLVQYVCLRPGYKPKPLYPLKCVVINNAAQWNHTTPVCVDVEKPTFKNCPPKILYVERLSRLNRETPIAQDNSKYLKSVIVRPILFHINQTILIDTPVTYVAEDDAGNVAECTFQIAIIDHEAPEIFCPGDQEYFLQTNKVLKKDDFLVNATDNSNSVTLTFEPEELHLKYKKSLSVYTMKVTATDPSNNTASCYIFVKVKFNSSEICRAENLILNALLNCSDIPDRVSCTISCRKNYKFYHNISAVSEVISCNFTNGLNREALFCVEEISSSYQLAVVYVYKTENITCIQNELMKEVPGVYKDFASQLHQFYGERFNITEPKSSYASPVSTELKNSSVYATVRLEYNGDANLWRKLKSHFDSYFAMKSGTDHFNPKCAPKKEILDSISGFKCSGNAKLVQENRCLTCPPGTYGFDFKDCLPCPQNTYNSQYGSSNCTTCPRGTYNSQKGSSSIQDCFDGCPEGTISATGHIPCKLCPINTYQFNKTFCETCQAALFTQYKGATSDRQCVDQCYPGYFSATGYAPCQTCPENTYSMFHKSTMCTPCNYNETSQPGSKSRSGCSETDICDRNPCKYGNCLVVRHHYECDCFPGYKGENCSVSIDPCISDPCYHNGTCQFTKDGNYTCFCDPNFVGRNCETNINHCKVDSCKNNGTCQNLYSTFRCLCPSWNQYTGDFCNETTSPCSSSPCHSNATCILHGKNFYCECPSGYTGELCNIDIDECQSSPCLNNGTCTNLLDMFSCSCQSGFSGRFCELYSDPCSLVNCTSNSKCIPDSSTNNAMCVCYPNFYKDNNGLCVPINSCIENKGTISCQCNPGYEGSLCQYNSKACGNLTCQNGTVCQEDKGIYQCVSNSNQTKAEETRTVCSFNVTNNCTNFDPRNHNCLVNGIAGVYCKENPCQGIQENGTCPCLPAFVNECDSKPCLNGATCLQSGNSSRCICSSGYYGKTCERKIDACQTVNHCLGSNSSCRMVNNKATCICPTGFGGIGCQDKSLCSPESCQNKGICLEKSNNITCTCPLGFTGEVCENVTNPCSKKSCAGQKCQVKNNQATCMCPSNKWGSQCLRDIPYGSDLVVLKPKGFFVPMNAPEFSRIIEDQLTMTFWIKYNEDMNNEKQASATSICLYGSNDLINPVFSAKELVHLQGNTLSLQMFDDTHTVTLKSLTNGIWHHVILQWSNSDGILLVYHNGDLTLEKNLGNGKQIPPLGLLVVGGKLNTKQSAIEASYFSGRISRLWILNQTLSKENLQNFWKNPSQTPSNILSNLVKNMLMLPNYLLDFQSEIKPDMCEIKKNCPQTNKISSPTVIKCPSDKLYISKPWSTLKWNKPEFKDVDRVISNYKPEVTNFDWDDYTVIYIGFDQYNSSAVCTFRIFNHQFECKKPSDPFEGTQHCWTENDSLLCKPKCNDASHKLVLLGPSFYACGPYHMWGKHNQSVPFKYPPCSATSKSLKNITLEFSIEFKQPYDDSQFSSICKLIKASLKEVLENRTDVSCPTGDCKLVVTINGKACAIDSQDIIRKKRSTSTSNVANIQVGINGIVLNPSQNQSTNLTQDMIVALIGNNELNTQLSAMNASLVLSSVKPQVVSYCTAGVLQGSSCVEAGPGTFWSSKHNTVKSCPKGTYQPNSRSSSCNNCTSGKTTETIQSVQESECKDTCPEGSYFQSSTSKCTQCSVGFYQDQPGMFQCEICRQGNTTNEKGSTSESECVILAEKKSDNTKLRTAAIVTIVVVLTLLLLAIILVVYFWKHLKKRCPCGNKVKKISPIVITGNGKTPSSEVIILPAKVINSPAKSTEDYSPRIYNLQDSSEHNVYHPVVWPKSNESERTVQKIHLANYHDNSQKIMVDSDEEDMR